MDFGAIQEGIDMSIAPRIGSMPSKIAGKTEGGGE
jgi:hypothetical protein